MDSRPARESCGRFVGAKRHIPISPGRHPWYGMRQRPFRVLRTTPPADEARRNRGISTFFEPAPPCDVVRNGQNPPDRVQYRKSVVRNDRNRSFRVRYHAGTMSNNGKPRMMGSPGFTHRHSFLGDDARHPGRSRRNRTFPIGRRGGHPSVRCQLMRCSGVGPSSAMARRCAADP